MSPKKRLQRDILDMIKDGDIIYLDKKTDDNEYIQFHLDKIYDLFGILSTKIPNDVIRDYILPYVQFPMRVNTFEKKIIKDIPIAFIVKKEIHNKIWDIHFTISSEFPFKPPKIRLNGISSLQIKNLGKDDVETFNLLKDIDMKFFNQWSPVIRIKQCVEFIEMAIDIHNNLPYKSAFLISVDKLAAATNTLKVC